MDEFKRILVPLDGSPLAEKALGLATNLAQKLDSQIILLRVLDVSTLTLPTWHLEAPPSWIVEAHEHIHEEVQNYLKTQQDHLREQGFEVRSLLRGATPAEGILEVANTQEIDLIVMSTHGRSGLTRWALGSVADKVMRQSHCPVLLVRQIEEDHNK
jgi:nucleotide-binding universal stress UspA family protein